jgi:hypothetical protein
MNPSEDSDAMDSLTVVDNDLKLTPVPLSSRSHAGAALFTNAREPMV